MRSGHAWKHDLASRGSGPGARKRRRDALGPRKDVIIRMPEELARQLKIVAACEETTVQDFCLDAIRPQIRETLAKHGIDIVR
jgi:hypothetical protein